MYKKILAIRTVILHSDYEIDLTTQEKQPPQEVSFILMNTTDNSSILQIKTNENKPTDYFYTKKEILIHCFEQYSKNIPPSWPHNKICLSIDDMKFLNIPITQEEFNASSYSKITYALLKEEFFPSESTHKLNDIINNQFPQHSSYENQLNWVDSFNKAVTEHSSLQAHPNLTIATCLKMRNVKMLSLETSPDQSLIDLIKDCSIEHLYFTTYPTNLFLNQLNKTTIHTLTFAENLTETLFIALAKHKNIQTIQTTQQIPLSLARKLRNIIPQKIRQVIPRGEGTSQEFTALCELTPIKNNILYDFLKSHFIVILIIILPLLLQTRSFFTKITSSFTTK